MKDEERQTPEELDKSSEEHEQPRPQKESLRDLDITDEDAGALKGGKPVAPI